MAAPATALRVSTLEAVVQKRSAAGSMATGMATAMARVRYSRPLNQGAPPKNSQRPAASISSTQAKARSGKRTLRRASSSWVSRRRFRSGSGSPWVEERSTKVSCFFCFPPRCPGRMDRMNATGTMAAEAMSSGKPSPATA